MWYAETGRCLNCDSRYCYTECHAGQPGYAYVVYHGWATFDVADSMERLGTTPEVYWFDAVPDPDPEKDAPRARRIAAAQRRNAIATVLAEWGPLLDPDSINSLTDQIDAAIAISQIGATS